MMTETPQLSFAVVTLAVAGVLLGLAIWEAAVGREQNRRSRGHIRDSQEGGTHRANAQHPTINPLLCIGCGSCVRACPEEGVLGLVNGVAHVMHLSWCVGHARCEAVCPVGAIEVGMGDLSVREDIPLLSPSFETSVTGLFVVGELGGMALIRNAIAQAVAAVQDIARRISSPSTDPHVVDVLVVGAGPAGLSAALQAVAEGLRVFVISQEDVGGTIRQYPRKKLTLIQSVQIPLFGELKSGEYTKETLMDLWTRLVKQNGILHQPGLRLEGVSPAPYGFNVLTSLGTYGARSVVLALGRRGIPRKLGVPGEDSGKVLYQLADAAGYTHKNILVVGGGDSAAESALALAEQAGNQVTLSYRKENFSRLKKKNHDRLHTAIAEQRIHALLSSEVVEIQPDRVTLKFQFPGGGVSVRTVANDQVFIFAGGDPPFPLLKKMGIRFGGEGARV